MGNREVQPEENLQCDICGKYGAYDFYGDCICQECIDTKKRRFLIIVHKWNVDSKGFVVEEYTGNSYEDAEREASLLSHAHRDDFTCTSAKIIELEQGDFAKAPTDVRKLTLMERLTGKAKKV